jgi:hypothetical protein
MQQSQIFPVNGGFVGFVPMVDLVRTTCGLRAWCLHAWLFAPRESTAQTPLSSDFKW